MKVVLNNPTNHKYTVPLPEEPDYDLDNINETLPIFYKFSLAADPQGLSATILPDYTLIKNQGRVAPFFHTFLERAFGAEHVLELINTRWFFHFFSYHVGKNVPTPHWDKEYTEQFSELNEFKKWLLSWFDSYASHNHVKIVEGDHPEFRSYIFHPAGHYGYEDSDFEGRHGCGVLTKTPHRLLTGSTYGN